MVVSVPLSELGPHTPPPLPQESVVLPGTKGTRLRMRGWGVPILTNGEKPSTLVYTVLLSLLDTTAGLQH
jgi:hypothetical protein